MSSEAAVCSHLCRVASHWSNESIEGSGLLVIGRILLSALRLEVSGLPGVLMAERQLWFDAMGLKAIRAP